MKGKLCWSWGLILLNIFINNLSHGLCCALLALAGDTKLVRSRGCCCCWPWLPLGRPWKAAGMCWNSGKANVEFSPWLLPSAAYKGLQKEGEAELFAEVKRKRTRVSRDRLQQGKFHLRIRETHSQWGWSPGAEAAGAEFLSSEISWASLCRAMSSRSHLRSLSCLEQEADQMISIDPAQPLLSLDGSVFVNAWLYLLSLDVRGKVPKDNEGEILGCSIEIWELVRALAFWRT